MATSYLAVIFICMTCINIESHFYSEQITAAGTSFEIVSDCIASWKWLCWMEWWHFHIRGLVCHGHIICEQYRYLQFQVSRFSEAKQKYTIQWAGNQQCSSKILQRVYPMISIRIAVDPEGIPGRVLKDCAEEFKDVSTDIFSSSVERAVVPLCFKAATSIPVPKKPSPTPPPAFS